ncbi:MAG: CDP-alcohol phosphatidyltransferase family protein, partial [Desulfobacteraceae bacterium]
RRKNKERKALTQFMATEQNDYPIRSQRYIAFECAAVGFLCKQEVIEPNHITYFRFAVSLSLLLFFSKLSYLQMLTLAAIGALSDFFDGALARAASKKTRLGIILDPLADKLLVVTLIYISLMRRAITPTYVLLILLMEAHLIVIPMLSWLRYGRKGKADGAQPSGGRDRGAFILKSNAAFLGKMKVHLYAYGFLSIFLGKAFESVFILHAGRWFLLSGIAAAAIAFCTYIIRWIKRPYSIF